LQSGTGNIIAALAEQGVGFAFLFVPLTTVALANVPRQQMPDATGLNSLIRQIGGAVGLAVFATYLGQYTSEARASLSAHVSEVNPLSIERLSAAESAFEARGMDVASAKHAALGALQGAVSRQAAVLSFDRVFLLCGLLFLCVLPLLVFLKASPSEGPRTKPPAHVEV
ncbi:MAG TPA: hypothetical protein VGP93_15400, partial [Polyangiaceae bacterium]|nr:hypothetical protein [Polyangiaceae bacterium]